MRKYILVIPLMDYFDGIFISTSELSYLETKFIDFINSKGGKKNLANKSSKIGALHLAQIDEIETLFAKIVKWINNNWKEEFYGKHN